MTRFLGRNLAALLVPLSALVTPHLYAARNPYGVHLLEVGGENVEKHLTWAHTLIGDGGHVKCFFTGIDQNTGGPRGDWARLIQGIYDRNMIPICRLAGHFGDGGWAKPQADAPGDYFSMAIAVRRVVEGLPRKEGVPLYVEVWNEPNLGHEWSGEPSAEEYAHFLVDVHRELKAIGDERIRVLNGATALDPEFAREMFAKVPESAQAFDVWASHPYPYNHPPEYNIHDRTAVNQDFTIDSYLLERAVLSEYGRRDAEVIITETGYYLGADLFAHEGFGIVDELCRADHIMRAFRDYWSKWPELIAVTPFQFCDPGGGWRQFEWVEPDSGTDENGWPTKRHLQYDYVAALAKPNDSTGAISGKLLEPETGQIATEVTLVLDDGVQRAQTDRLGNYFFSRLAPGPHRITLWAGQLRPLWAGSFQVVAGQNAVEDLKVAPTAWASIEGYVREMGTDLPLAALVRLAPGRRTQTSNAQGLYRFAEVLPGTYALAAQAPGYGPARQRDVIARAGRTETVFLRLGRFAATGSGRNLMSNVGFEDEQRNGLGVAWAALGGGPAGGTFYPVSQVVHGGSSSQAVRVREGEARGLEQFSAYNIITPGREHVAGAWAVALDLPAGRTRAALFVDFTDNDGNSIAKHETRAEFALPGRWAPLTISATAPEGAQRLRLGLQAEGRDGTICFDDVYAGED